MFSTRSKREIASWFNSQYVRPSIGFWGPKVITKKERSEGLQYKRRMHDLDAPGDTWTSAFCGGIFPSPPSMTRGKIPMITLGVPSPYNRRRYEFSKEIRLRVELQHCIMMNKGREILIYVLIACPWFCSDPPQVEQPFQSISIYFDGHYFFSFQWHWPERHLILALNNCQ